MEKRTKIFTNGKAVEYTMHEIDLREGKKKIVKKNGSFWLMFEQSAEEPEWSKCYKYVGGGWMSYSQVPVAYAALSLNRIYLG